MINLRTDSQTSTSPNTAVTAEKAFSFISKGWREVKDSAESDLQLLKARANSFKDLANSFDKELENFINSASAFSVPAIRSSSPTEIDFVKRLQPKISEFRRNYSSPDFSRKVLEKWSPRSRIRLDLSAIKNAIVSEVEDRDGIVEFDESQRFRRGRRFGLKEFRWDWGGEDEGTPKEWEPIRQLKSRLKEFERKSSSSEIFESLKNNEFVEKVKLSLKRDLEGKFKREEIYRKRGQVVVPGGGGQTGGKEICQWCLIRNIPDGVEVASIGGLLFFSIQQQETHAGGARRTNHNPSCTNLCSYSGGRV